MATSYALPWLKSIYFKSPLSVLIGKIVEFLDQSGRYSLSASTSSFDTPNIPWKPFCIPYGATANTVDKPSNLFNPMFLNAGFFISFIALCAILVVVLNISDGKWLLHLLVNSYIFL